MGVDSSDSVLSISWNRSSGNDDLLSLPKVSIRLFLLQTLLFTREPSIKRKRNDLFSQVPSLFQPNFNREPCCVIKKLVQLRNLVARFQTIISLDPLFSCIGVVKSSFCRSKLMKCKMNQRNWKCIHFENQWILTDHRCNSPFTDQEHFP